MAQSNNFGYAQSYDDNRSQQYDTNEEYGYSTEEQQMEYQPPRQPLASKKSYMPIDYGVVGGGRPSQSPLKRQSVQTQQKKSQKKGKCNPVQEALSFFLDDGYQPTQSIPLPLASAKFGYHQKVKNIVDPTARSFLITAFNSWGGFSIVPNPASPTASQWFVDAGFLPNAKPFDVYAMGGLGSFAGTDERAANRWLFIEDIPDALNQRVNLLPLSILPFTFYQPPAVPEGYFPAIQVHQGPYKRIYYMTDFPTSVPCTWVLKPSRHISWAYYQPVSVSAHRNDDCHTC